MRILDYEAREPISNGAFERVVLFSNFCDEDSGNIVVEGQKLTKITSNHTRI